MQASTTIHRLTALAGACALAAMLSACGGGEGDPGTNGELQPAPGYAVVQGQLTDSTGAPLAGAQVLAPFGTNQAWGGDTDAQGKFAFQARAADFAGVNPVAVVIHKAGYRPATVYFGGIQQGARYLVPANASTSPQALADGEYLAQGLVGLWHLGDDSFSGSVNSKLQTGTRGRLADFEITTWTAAHKAAYSQAVVEFVGRGIQGLTCTTQFGLAALGAAAGSGIPRYTNPGNSDVNGGFTRFSLRLNVADFPVGAQVRLVAISGNCASDLDDFEFTEAVVRFQR
jgi:hypothetical protein